METENPNQRSQTMQPDSLLDAVKKTATALDLPWPTVQKIYRNLQEQDDFGTFWLPKSQGRKIWFAHPNFVTSIILAVGFSQSRLTAHQSAYLGHILTPNGRPVEITERATPNYSIFIELMGDILTNPEKAGHVDKLTFSGGDKSVSIHFVTGETTNFALDGSFETSFGDDAFDSGILAAAGVETYSRTNFNVSIDGAAFVEIANTVTWKTAATPPFGMQKKVEAAS
ncbi:hypothetical protein [Sulfitobacter geojensis]|uniref:hypothetical protein n=1 Tax=Sulfitobacter geojensis TaxID=1342299 RepID=UPI0010FE0B2E|nr:hypothetical protein [Sulfitobacter geojensis]